LDMSGNNVTIAGLTGTGMVRTGTSTGGVLTVADNGATNTFYGFIAENGSFVKSGPGRFIMAAGTNATPFTGNVVVAQGVLQVGSVPTAQYINQLGVIPAVVGGRTVFLGSGSTLELDGRDLLNNNMTIAAANATITNNGFSTFGPITLSGSQMYCGFGNSAAYQNYALAGDVTVTGSTASAINKSSATFSGIHLQKAGGVTFNVSDVTLDANPDLIVTAVLTNMTNNGGAGSLTKTGAGTMRLDAVNGYSGSTTINGGTLALGSSGAITNSTIIATATGAVLDVSTPAAIAGSYRLGPTETLQGYGIVTGDITAVRGNIIAAGTVGAPGTLTLQSSIFMNAGVTNVFDLTNDFNAVGSGTNDLIVSTGSVFDPALATLRINPLIPLPAGTYENRGSPPACGGAVAGAARPALPVPCPAVPPLRQRFQPPRRSRHTWEWPA